MVVDKCEYLLQQNCIKHIVKQFVQIITIHE